MAGIIQWIIANQALCAGVAVAVIDLIWALVPSLKSNGILHSVYDFLFTKKSPVA